MLASKRGAALNGPAEHFRQRLGGEMRRVQSSSAGCLRSFPERKHDHEVRQCRRASLMAWLVLRPCRRACLAHASRLQARLGVTPTLAVVLVGDNPASRVYVKSKSRRATA